MTFHFNPDKKYLISTEEINRLSLTSSSIDASYQKDKDIVSSKLEPLLKPVSGIIEGDILKNLIFPTKKWDFDVFISHSHNNLIQAKRLAAYLFEKKSKRPFLDNFVWGSADELLNKIDRDYCMHYDGKSYDYNKRNFSTSHVHAMLSMAIFEMIARCETFIFIESNDSVDYNALKERNKKTLSPWLYQELQYARMLSIASQRVLNEQKIFSQGGSLKISYGIDLSDFERLTAKTLEKIDSL